MRRRPAPRPAHAAGRRSTARRHELHHGSVVIAAITSCTNTSNPSVMMAAGLLAKKAVERGLQTKPWVKTSLAPGSKVVTDYLIEAGADARPWSSCASTSSATAARPASATAARCRRRCRKAIDDGDLVVAAVLSGNRNFEGRVHPEVRANYLASPPLVVAYALAGRMDIDLRQRAARHRHATASRSSCRTSGRRSRRCSEAIDAVGAARRCSARSTARSSRATSTGRRCRCRRATCTPGTPTSTYVKHPPYFEGMTPQPAPVQDIHGARVLACWATASRPTTSRRPARSRRTARRAST